MNCLKSKLVFLFLLVQVFILSVEAGDWTQWLGSKRDGVWRESGILKKFPNSFLREESGTTKEGQPARTQKM